jgi:outer membrane lipoprotein carrier protein
MRVLVMLASLLAPLVAVTAPDSEEGLWQRLAGRDAAAGRFLQELYDENGELMERSTGRYAILKPHFFRWEIDDPDRQILLVSGDTLWHYDVDLATATQRRSDAPGAFGPLELLGGDIASLRARFQVEALTADRYRLLPTYPQAGFSAVVLEFDGAELSAMQVRDRSGQRLELALTPEPSGPPLKPGDFDFTAPPGVEVFREPEP